MKKSLLMLGVAVAALASCTQNEVVDIAESNVIKFDNAFVGKATKAVTATEVTTKSINDMYVFAVKGSSEAVFGEQNWHVYRTAGSEWGYDGNPVAWENTSYKFVAYAGEKLSTAEADNNKVEYVEGSNSLKFTNILVDKDHQFDLMCSNGVLRDNSGGSGDRSEIQFTFSHLLSMVQFTLNSGFGEDVKVAISDFKFHSVVTKGSYDSGWSLGSETVDFTVANDEDDYAQYATAGSKSVVNSWFIIPQTNTTSDPSVEMVEFKVTATSEDGFNESTTIKAKLPKITWDAGNRYNYILNIDPTAMGIEEKYITFDSPEVTPLTPNDATLDSDAYSNN